MKEYILKRLLLFIPTLIGTALAIFILLRVLPGDVAEIILSGPAGQGSFAHEDVLRLREDLGLDKPIYVQFGQWVWDMVRGDLGESYVTRRSISAQIKNQIPVTLQLAALSALTVAAVGIPIGILAAVRRDSLLDVILRGWAILGLATPSFFAGLLVILGLSTIFRWMPPVGFSHMWVDPVVSIQQLVFPALALGFASNGLLLRMMRTQLLEVLGDDYVRTARSKGLSNTIVIWRHAVRNALLPVVTTFGFQVGALLSGTVVIEAVFSVPGVGGGLVAALLSRDLPMIQIYIIYFAVLALVVNLLVDLTYAWLDPRIRYE
ncbi:MAG: peptide/nickel transport system permease protein [Chloroflexi bacterium]|jgi:peptide/nickel transport system permease protein|nr:MAG: peptide/nickel transport system permease protein [Chloroflexota bacterium]